jgi:hypothetical protein
MSATDSILPNYVPSTNSYKISHNVVTNAFSNKRKQHFTSEQYAAIRQRILNECIKTEFENVIEAFTGTWTIPYRTQSFHVMFGELEFELPETWRQSAREATAIDVIMGEADAAQNAVAEEQYIYKFLHNYGRLVFKHGIDTLRVCGVDMLARLFGYSVDGHTLKVGYKLQEYMFPIPANNTYQHCGFNFEIDDPNTTHTYQAKIRFTVYDETPEVTTAMSNNSKLTGLDAVHSETTRFSRSSPFYNETSSIDGTNVRIRVSASTQSAGIFITHSKINSLEHIEIQANGNSLIEFDKESIINHCQKYGYDTIYVPLVTKVDTENGQRTYKTFEESFNQNEGVTFSSIDNLSLSLIFESGTNTSTSNLTWSVFDINEWVSQLTLATMRYSS